MGITPRTIDEIMKALEVGVFAPMSPHETGIRRTLGRLGIKSAEQSPSMGSFIFESLEATLKASTFNDANLKLWDSLANNAEKKVT